MHCSEPGKGCKFDLLAHAFRTLGVDPTTSQQDLLSVLKEANQTASMNDLTSIRDAFFDRSRRLIHELAYPLDCARSDIDDYYAALAGNLATENLLGFSNRLRPLARANFLAHVASHRPASGRLLCELVRSHAALDPTEIHVLIRTTRAAAGIPAPSFLSINQCLSELRKIHLRAAFLGYHAAQDAAAPMLECARQVLASSEGNCSKALGRLLQSYKHAIDQARNDAFRGIAQSCATLLSDSSDNSSIRYIAEFTDVWTTLCRPLLAWNASHPKLQPSLDTPLAPLRALIRALYESEQLQVAAEVTAVTREIFAAVPITLDQLAEDARLFAAVSAYRSVEQLHQLIHQADMDASSLVAALEKTGFGDTSAGDANRFWQCFVDAAAVSASREPSAWRAMHDFAVRLSNRPGAAGAVVALLTGLIHHGERSSLPAKMLGELCDSLAFMRSFIGAEPAVDDTRGNNPPAQGGSRLATVSARLAKLFSKNPWHRKSSRQGRWGKPAVGAGLLATVALSAFALYFGFDRLPFWPTESSAATTAQAAIIPLGVEMVPQIATGQRLALEAVRYCHYQQERLRFVKQWLNGADDTRAYNLLIVDYNSRCSDFFYRDEDLKQVETEVGAKKDLLEADARRIISAWPGHGSERASRS
jgi:hypothetical protein